MSAFTNLGQNAPNGLNPATSVAVAATASPTTAGDKVLVALVIPNSNPTFAANGVTFNGNNMTEIASARGTRSNKTLCVFYYDDAAGTASGVAINAAWTNAGTAGGGGANISAGTMTPTNAFVAGGPEQVVSNQSGVAATTITSGTTGTPSDTAANYFAACALGTVSTTAGMTSTAGNTYTELPQALNTTRAIDLEFAAKELAPTVAAQTESWTINWTNLGWVMSLMLFKETVPGAPVNSSAPVLSGTAAVGNTLSVTDGSWTNTPTSFRYDWQRDVGTSGVSWVSIGSSQSCTTTITNPSVVVTSIVSLYVGQPVFGAGIQAGTVISEIPDSTHVVLSQNATASATVTLYFGADGTAASYPVTADDLGSEVRCAVTATNANGSSAPTASNASGVTPAPSTATVRVVVLPVGQSDNQIHSSTLRLPVLAGETLVYLGGCSIPNIDGDIGTVTDPNGDTWTQIAEIASGGVAAHCTQAFSAVCAAGMAYGSVITTHIKQTNVVGVNALNSAVINVGTTAGGSAGSGFNPAGGAINVNGVAVTYTGITPTSLTGCGTHAAYTGGELVQYHGQSPYWMVVALNAGSGSTLSFDTQSSSSQANTKGPTSGNVNTAGPRSLAVGYMSMSAIDVLTPGAGWTKIQDGPNANAGNPYTGESTYGGRAAWQLLSSPQIGFSFSGTTPDFQATDTLVVVFSVTPVAAAVAQQIVPYVRTVGLH